MSKDEFEDRVSELIITVNKSIEACLATLKSNQDISAFGYAFEFVFIDTLSKILGSSLEIKESNYERCLEIISSIKDGIDVIEARLVSKKAIMKSVLGSS